jgi:hypothetical protein
MNFNFQFGKNKPNKKQLIIVGIIVPLIISTLSQCTKISENNLWDLYDEIQRKFFPQKLFNELIIQDPEKLKRRIERDVTGAISDYEKWEEKNRVVNMKNENILKEIKKYKYSDTQRLIIENAEYYEFPPDGSNAQNLLGGTMGIRGIWTSKENQK